RAQPNGMFNEYGVPNGGDSGTITGGPDGNLWFTEPLHDRIGRVTPQAAFMQYNLPTAGGHPLGIALGPDGNLWFTEPSGNKIGRVSDLAGSGSIASSAVDATAPLSNGTKCVKDADCISSGKACGGDVCSYAVTPHVCALAVSGDPGWCTTDADCWCQPSGATCNATSHHCSSTR